MQGYSNLKVTNNVNDLHFSIAVVSGTAGDAPFTLSNEWIRSGATSVVAGIQRGVPSDKKYTVRVSTSEAGLPIHIDFWIFGTTTDSNMTVTGTIGAQSSSGLTDYPQQALLSDKVEFNGAVLGFMLLLQRVSDGVGHDDVTAVISPGTQVVGGNFPLPPWTDLQFIKLLDVGGEGRIIDTSTTPAMISGFPDAYNVNAASQAISNGPDKGKDIPNKISVQSWDAPKFPMPDSSVIFMTMMGTPIHYNSPVVAEMMRCLDKTKGVIILYDHTDAERAAFASALPANFVLKLNGVPVSQLGHPFNEVSFHKAYQYGWAGHTDHDEL